MFQLYSSGCQYALRALMHAGKKADQDSFTAKDICKKADIPESFTRKILQALVRGKFLKAVTGPGGGYRLARHASRISVLEVIEEVDGPGTFSQCLMKFSECDCKNPCPLHDVWVDSKQKMLTQLSKMTVQDLIRGV